MKPLVKCTACISEGRRAHVISTITEAMARAGGVYILDRQESPSQNRSQIDLLGLPQEVEKAVIAGAGQAASLINLAEHEGDHPRFGALDTLAVMPVRDVSLEDCVELAHQWGRRIAQELELPVYFYEAAAIRPEHRDLHNIYHAGFQFEQLAHHIEQDPFWMPDLGPAWLGTAGAVLIGAHQLPVELTLLLNTEDLPLTRQLAQSLHYAEGGLHFVKSRVQQGGQIEVSLMDYEKTPLARVVESLRQEAQRFGVNLRGCQLRGLVPQAALDGSAAWYLQLHDFAPDQIFERRLQQAEGEQVPLAGEEPPIPEDATKHVAIPENASPAPAAIQDGHNLENFLQSIANDTVTPGGGAAAALAGALAAALAEMVAALTLGKRGYGEVEPNMRAIQVAASSLRGKLLQSMLKDVEAFQNFMAAIRLPRSDSQRPKAIQVATVEITEVSLETAKRAYEALQLSGQVVELGNHNAVIDATVGAHIALAALEGAAINVRVNVLGLSDAQVHQHYVDEVAQILAQARPLHRHIVEVAEQRAGLES